MTPARYALALAVFVVLVAALAVALDGGRSRVTVPSFGSPSVSAPLPPVYPMANNRGEG